MPRAEGLPLRAGWIAAAVVAAGIGAGVLYGLPVGVLCLAGGVLVGVVLLVWTSVQNLTGSTPLSLEEALSLGAPSKEEENKQSVLRALKDLEYERSVGKISEADYQELSTRYRTEAKALLQTLDQGLDPYRKRVVEAVERRVQGSSPKNVTEEAPAAIESEAAAGEATEPPVATTGSSGHPEPEGQARVECPACGARNEGDARFCKGCGGKLGEAPS